MTAPNLRCARVERGEIRGVRKQCLHACGSDGTGNQCTQAECGESSGKCKRFHLDLFLTLGLCGEPLEAGCDRMQRLRAEF